MEVDGWPSEASQLVTSLWANLPPASNVPMTCSGAARADRYPNRLGRPITRTQDEVRSDRSILLLHDRSLWLRVSASTRYRDGYDANQNKAADFVNDSGSQSAIGHAQLTQGRLHDGELGKRQVELAPK